MNMQKKSFYLGFLIILPAVSFPVNAQPADIPQYGPMPFAAFDRDHNGLISEKEFNAVRSDRMAKRAAEGRPMRGAAGAPVFSDLDTNGDGQLTQQELAAGQKAQMQKRPGMGQGPGMGRGMGQGPGSMGPGQGYGQGPGMGRGQGPGMGRGMGRNMPAFSDFDFNRDGRITEKEFNEARSRRMSERAEQGYRMRNMDNAPSFSDLDSNGSGEISAEEFYTHQSQRRQERGQR